MNALRIAAERSISSLTAKVQSTEKYCKFRCVHDVSLLTPPIPWPQHQGRPGPALRGLQLCPGYQRVPQNWEAPWVLLTQFPVPGGGSEHGVKKENEAASVAVGLSCTQMGAVICPHVPSAEARREILADGWVAGERAFVRAGQPGEDIFPGEGARGPEAR